MGNEDGGSAPTGGRSKARIFLFVIFAIVGMLSFWVRLSLSKIQYYFPIYLLKGSNGGE